MKYKFTNYTLPILGMLMAACSAEDAMEETTSVIPPVAQEKEVVFSAQIESDVDTRTAFDSNLKTVWSASDRIKIFNSTQSDNKVFLLAGEGGTKNGTFKQDKQTTDEENLKLAENDAVYAFYPFDKGSFSDTSVSESVPAKQPAANASTPFATGYSYMLAKADADNNLAFKNIISFIKVTVTPSENFQISRIKIVANTSDNSVNLSGTFSATVNDSESEPVISKITDGSTYAEVNGSGLSGTYYIAVLPTASKVPVTLLIEDVEGNKAYQRLNSGLKIDPSQVYDFGAYTATDATANNVTTTTVTASLGSGNPKPILEDVIDLGLPSGTLWAKRNIVHDGGTGFNNMFVSSDYEYGSYYAWGEVGQTMYTYYAIPIPIIRPTYGDRRTYCDTNQQLYYENDIACVKSGGVYCMPTHAQFQELWSQCENNDYLGQNNVGEYRMDFMRNDKTLMLPAGGCYWSGSAHDANNEAQYWSRTLEGSHTYLLVFSTTTAYCFDVKREQGGPAIDQHTGIFDGASPWYDRGWAARSIRPVVTNQNIAPVTHKSN